MYLFKALAALKPAGVVSIIGFLAGGKAEKQPSFLEALMKHIIVRGIVVGSKAMLQDMVEAIDANGIKPVVDQKGVSPSIIIRGHAVNQKFDKIGTSSPFNQLQLLCSLFRNHLRCRQPLSHPSGLISQLLQIPREIPLKVSQSRRDIIHLCTFHNLAFSGAFFGLWLMAS